MNSFYSWQIPVVFGALFVIVPLVIRRPVVALYVLVGAAVVIEIFPLGYADSFTDTIPFFLNVNNSAGLPVSISPAEIVMAVALIAWATGAAGERALHRPGTRIIKVYGVYMLAVLMAEGFGLVSGGDFNKSLWEMRPQVYGFILFILTASLVRERRQIVIIASIFFAGAAIKAGVGYNRYFNTLGGNVPTTQDAILAHEDSYFLLMYLIGTVAAAIWVRRRKIVIPLLVASPIVALIMLENKRRVAELALIAGLATVLVLAIRFESVVRRRVIIFTLIGASAFALYCAAEWNANDGLAAQVVRPLRTTLTGQTDQRDFLSNLYRVNENLDIKATYQLNPLLGIGFGRPFLVPFPLADITQQYPLWQYMPHNSLLWVAMRMGLVGMGAFWGLICIVVLEGVRVIRTQQDPLLRGVAAFALAAVMAELLVAYGDVQLENYRNMIFFGMMLGLIDAIPSVQTARVEDEVEETVPVPRWAPVPTLNTTTHMRG
jgi:hypothetical protein